MSEEERQERWDETRAGTDEDDGAVDWAGLVTSLTARYRTVLRDLDD